MDTGKSDKNPTEETTEKPKAESPDVPIVDPDAPLKIEQAKKPSSDIPETNLEAPLKIETAEAPEEEVLTEKSSRLFFVLGGVITLVIILTSVTIWYFYFKAPAGSKVVTPVEIQLVEKEGVKLERSAWTFEILNGSGIAGAAKKTADKLESLGYKVVKIGNADDQDYKVNELFISKELVDKTDLLLEELGKELDIATIAGELQDSTAAARIIVGKGD